MLTLHVSCFIKVDDNKTRMKWNKILVDSERAAEIWPRMTKLSWVVNKQQKLNKNDLRKGKRRKI